MATPHIEAEKGSIAEIVLMPGDPLRAKFIADTYLKDVIMFNKVRNMFGYTGYYNDKKISVMGSGMGIPSMGIYSYELYKFYNVKKIIRIGTCGALANDLHLLDVVLADAVYSDSTFGYVHSGSKEDFLNASYELTNKIAETAKNNGILFIRGNIYSSDVFDPYKEWDIYNPSVINNGCIAAEMETFALFHNAKILGREAACILTVSDSHFDNTKISAEEREASLGKMIELALKSL